MEKQIINSNQAPTPIGPYSQAVLVNGTLYCSGQIAIDPESGEMRMANLKEETHQVMKNLHAVLKEAGMDFNHVVKVSIFLSDMAHFAEVNAVYAEYFANDYPARETVAVKTLPKSVNVEISLIAAK